MCPTDRRPASRSTFFLQYPLLPEFFNKTPVHTRPFLCDFASFPSRQLRLGASIHAVDFESLHIIHPFPSQLDRAEYEPGLHPNISEKSAMRPLEDHLFRPVFGTIINQLLAHEGRKENLVSRAAWYDLFYRISDACDRGNHINAYARCCCIVRSNSVAASEAVRS